MLNYALAFFIIYRNLERGIIEMTEQEYFNAVERLEELLAQLEAKLGIEPKF